MISAKRSDEMKTSCYICLLPEYLSLRVFITLFRHVVRTSKGQSETGNIQSYSIS